MSKVHMHMIIFIEIIIWIIKSVPNMIFIDNLHRVQEGITSKVLRHMSHHRLGMPRIVIDTNLLRIIVDHYHLMTVIDKSHLMIIIDKSLLMPVIDK